MVGSASDREFGALPIPRTRLIGREAEIATANSFLLDEAVPLLTLTGPEGVGKTRLALAVAQGVADHFAEGGLDRPGSSKRPDTGASHYGCPTLQVVATSRAPLQLRGEHLLRVEPPLLPAVDAPLEAIAEAEAVRLFTARARSVRPHFQVETANAVAVAQLCHHLDGLPLAIELDAAHSSVLSPAAMLAQMIDSLHLLRGGARDLPSRQQTMRDTHRLEL